jgi:hypothetical protein
MTDNLPATRPHFAPVSYDAATNYIVRSVRSGGHYEGKDFVSLRLPTPEQRQALLVRSRALQSALDMWDNKAVAQSVADLLSCWRDALLVGNNDDRPKALRQIVAKFVQELKGIPTWACQRACDTIRMGNAPSYLEISMAYPCSTIQVRVLAMSYVEIWRKELIDVHDALRAKKIEVAIPQEERERVKNGLDALAKDMRARVALDIETPEVIRKKLVAKIGQEAFNKIPDAPKQSRFWRGIREVQAGKRRRSKLTPEELRREDEETRIEMQNW